MTGEFRIASFERHGHFPRVKDGAKGLSKFATQAVYRLRLSGIDLPLNAQRVNVHRSIDGYVFSSTIHGWFEGFLYGKPGIFVLHKLGLLSPEIRFFSDSYDDGEYSVFLTLLTRLTNRKKYLKISLIFTASKPSALR